MPECSSCNDNAKSEAHETYQKMERMAWNERARTLREAKASAQRRRELAQVKYRAHIRKFEEELHNEEARVRTEYEQAHREATAKYEEAKDRLWKEYERQRAKELGLG
jgi:hypothetical protein